MSLMKTKSEKLFEAFLIRNQIPFERIAKSETRTPDYLVTCADTKTVFEVKELSKDDKFSTAPLAVSSRTVGEHIRSKITQARKQIQWGSARGYLSILLIYNNLDRSFQMFGTEDIDFVSAMYGEHTLEIDDTSRIRTSYFGKRNSLSGEKNTSFSALGRSSDRNAEIEITLFENAFAEWSIPYERLSPCWNIVRVTIT
jgi:hypothetical protein